MVNINEIPIIIIFRLPVVFHGRKINEIDAQHSD